jgi:hypothetical protein
MNVGAQHSPIISHGVGDGVRMLRPIIAPIMGAAAAGLGMVVVMAGCCYAPTAMRWLVPSARIAIRAYGFSVSYSDS